MIEERFLIEEVSSPQSAIELLEDTARRYVVFMDIMGFKDKVARMDHNELRKQLIDFNAAIFEQARPYGGKIQLAQFSDSIVLFSNDDSVESLENIAKVSRNIMYTAIARQIPLKGAIALGTITCDTAKQLFFGQALIDAYLLEENIQYYGVLVHHSAEKSIMALDKPYFKDIKAPLKSGAIRHYELSWYLEESNPSSVKEVQDNLSRIRHTVSDSPRRYIDNTNEVINCFYNSVI